MMILKWFYRIQCIKAVYPDETSELRNLPMYDNDIKLYKNAQTKIALEVKRSDRKTIKVGQDKIYYLNVISPSGDEFLLRKQMEVQDIRLGRLGTTITKTDLDTIKQGRYYYSISFVDNTVETPEEFLLQVDRNGNSHGNFVVEHNALPVQRPPFIQNDFMEVRTYKDTKDGQTQDHDISFVSSRLPLQNSQHTVTLTMDGFVGQIEIEVTKHIDPYDQEQWENFDTIPVIISDTQKQFVFQNTDQNLKYMRVKFIRYFDNEGEVTKLEYV